MLVFIKTHDNLYCLCLWKRFSIDLNSSISKVHINIAILQVLKNLCSFYINDGKVFNLLLGWTKNYWRGKEFISNKINGLYIIILFNFIIWLRTCTQLFLTHLSNEFSEISQSGCSFKIISPGYSRSFRHAFGPEAGTEGSSAKMMFLKNIIRAPFLQNIYGRLPFRTLWNTYGEVLGENSRWEQIVWQFLRNWRMIDVWYDPIFAYGPMSSASVLWKRCS